MRWCNRSYYEVTGYTADADTWCPDCAEVAYFPRLLLDSVDCKDREGNVIAPIFLGSEWDYQPCCAACGAKIDVALIQRTDKKR